VSRVTIYLNMNTEERKELKRILKEKKYSTISEFVRDKIREIIEEYEKEKEKK